MVSISRRRAMKTVSAGIASTALAPTWLDSAQAQARPFTWAATGGTWGETLKRVFIDPFAQAHNLQPVHSAQLESIALSKILASCGNPIFDVSNGPQADYDLLNDSKCLEAYDPGVVKGLGDIYPEARQGDFYVAFNILLFGITWNTKEATRPARGAGIWFMVFMASTIRSVSPAFTMEPTSTNGLAPGEGAI